jgi:protein-disulfide isomerase
LELDTTPRIGSQSAPHVVTTLFDYTCSHCRSLHDLLESAHQRFGERLVILTLPMPLDRSCNPLVQQTAGENVNACDYARLGLAVWRANPEAFRRFNAWVFATPRPPAVESTRRHAEELVGAGALQRALADEWVQRQLRTAIELFEANSKRAGVWQLPQLIVGSTLSIGAIGTTEALDALLREHLDLYSAPLNVTTN